MKTYQTEISPYDDIQYADKSDLTSQQIARLLELQYPTLVQGLKDLEDAHSDHTLALIAVLRYRQLLSATHYKLDRFIENINPVDMEFLITHFCRPNSSIERELP